jgi:hypothetical protein
MDTTYVRMRALKGDNFFAMIHEHFESSCGLKSPVHHC